MCLSPDEMTVAQLEESHEYYARQAERHPDDRFYAGRRDAFAAVLKERAEQGRMAEA